MCLTGLEISSPDRSDAGSRQTYFSTPHKIAQRPFGRVGKSNGPRQSNDRRGPVLYVMPLAGYASTALSCFMKFK